MADDEEAPAPREEVEEVEQVEQGGAIDLTEEEPPISPDDAMNGYIKANLASGEGDKKRGVGRLWRDMTKMNPQQKKKMKKILDDGTAVVQSANKATKETRKQQDLESEAKKFEAVIKYKTAKAEDFAEMVEAWFRKRAGKPLDAREKKLAAQFESLSEAERLSLAGGSEAGGGGKGWGSEPLADTDAFVVESERSPGGTHRQRKRTARELAALRAAGAG